MKTALQQSSLLLFVFSLLLLQGCNKKKPDTTSAETTVTTPPADDKMFVSERVKSFYNWYAKNYEKVNAFDIVAVPKDEELGPYIIDMDAAEEELAFLKKSGFFSDTYIEARRAFYKEREARYAKPNIIDGDPEGFTFDPFTNSQGGVETVQALASVEWKSEIDGKTAVSESPSGGTGESPGMKVKLADENGVWMITEVK